MRRAALKPCFTMRDFLTTHPIFKGTCCPRTDAILQRAIDIGASEEELRMFKGFFNLHPNSDLKVYRLAREKGDGSFERLLAKALEDADQFKGRAKELLYDCFLEDLAGKDGTVKKDNETLYAILVGKIEEHRRNSQAQGQTRAETSEPPAFADLFTNDEAMEKALAAAREVGIINEANRWDYGRNVGAVVIFWEFLRGRVDVVNRSHENNPLAIDSIAAYFGTTISDRTKRDAPKYRGELLKELRTAWK